MTLPGMKRRKRKVKYDIDSIETSHGASVKHGFAQGAFNVNAVAQAKAAIQVHEMFRSAAILQGADLANGFMGGDATL